jgi:hypothetical protein
VETIEIGTSGIIASRRGACTLLRTGIALPTAKILLALAALLPSLPALAQRHEEEGHGAMAAFHEHDRGGEDHHWGGEDHHWGGEDHHWHGDITRFHGHDWDLWRSGRWVNEEHDGRRGWWWVAGDAWYFYPAPVYPYPDPYEPPEIITEAASAAPPDAPVPKNWYYCEGARGYYPYVQTCPGGWKAVPANPARS